MTNESGTLNVANNEIIEEILLRDGVYLSTTRGVSMRPMLKTGRDVVVIKSKNGRLKKWDVALYKRDSAYILHRVIEVKEDYYIIRGDNTYVDEIVPESCVIGVLSEFFNKKKTVSVTDEKYLRYVRRTVKFYPLRRVFAVAVMRVKKVVKKIIGKK